MRPLLFLFLLGVASAQQHDAAITWSTNFFDPATPRTASYVDGTQISFTWPGDAATGGLAHNVYLMPSKTAFDSCDFTGATDLGSASGVTFQVRVQGLAPPRSTTGESSAFYFACQIPGHCQAGQKLEVTVAEQSCDIFACPSGVGNHGGQGRNKAECCNYNCNSFYNDPEYGTNIGQCTAPGMLRPSHDHHVPHGGGSWWLGATAAELEQECCQQNCASTFASEGITCDEADGTLRSAEDMHSPSAGWYGSHEQATYLTGVALHTYLKSEQAGCCQRSCTSAMAARGFACPAGSAPHMQPGHMPWGDDWNKTEAEYHSNCCQSTSDCNAFPATSCPSGTLHRGGHWPAALTAAECCAVTCHSTLSQRGLTCPSGTEARSDHDTHDPFGGTAGDWSGQTDEQLLAPWACCPMTCHAQMMNRSLADCGDKGEMRPAGDFHTPSQGWTGSHDPSSPLTGAALDDYITSECCQQSCFSIFQSRSLSCDGGTQARSEHDHYTPRQGW